MRNIIFILFLLSGSISSAQNNVLSKNDVVFESAALDRQPEYPGGITAFYKFVQYNFRAPDVTVDMTLKIYFTFVIEKDGTISNISSTNDPGHGIREEGIRILGLVKEKWVPGMNDGVPVRSAYKFPIVLNIAGAGQTEKND